MMPTTTELLRSLSLCKACLMEYVRLLEAARVAGFPVGAGKLLSRAGLLTPVLL
jgi:hypothetical protein